MTPDQIQAACVEGTRTYLAYLQKTDKGVDRIIVTGIERVVSDQGQAFKLTLGGRLFDTESISIEVRPPNRLFGPADFRVEEYDAETRTVIVNVLNSELQLSSHAPDEVQIVSDLRFLVRNVMQWFAQNGAQVRLPARENAAPAPPRQDADPQQQAIAGSMESPLCYVWGPPGTGKTKRVLTQVVLKLAAAGQQVGIFAPTNNALEQAMTAVLEEIDSTHVVRREDILRVGTPSRQFAERFPESCEVQKLRRQVENLRTQIAMLERLLAYRRGPVVLGSVATLQHQLQELKKLLFNWKTLHEEMAERALGILSRLLSRLSGRTAELEDNRKRLEREINGMVESIRRSETESERLNKLIARLSLANVDEIQEGLRIIESEARHFMDVNRALAAEHEHETSETIEKRKLELAENLKALVAQSLTERVKSAVVVGMTLDSFIGKFRDERIPFEHIFLDEAGYASAVKALTLFRFGIPLTFFGDHKQLGPVCEMGERVFTVPENAAASVWLRSALFCPLFFQAPTPDHLVEKLVNGAEPDLSAFDVASLRRTYRFGQNLADILAEVVYDGFELEAAGTGKRNLEILCLDAVLNHAPAERRQNEAEAEVIGRYLRGNPELLNNPAENAFAIITPYKRQVALLNRRLPEARRQGLISTVHKAQGREWDTVILSVVDGPFSKPWFTDTQNQASGGLYVMNTAISRARKRLVIVCDQRFWINLQDGGPQLVSRVAEAS